MPLRRAPEALICPGAPRASSTEGRAVVRSGVLRQVEALLLPHLADDDAGGPHPQRLLDQLAQRDLPGALEVGLAGLHRHHVGQRHAELGQLPAARNWSTTLCGILPRADTSMPLALAHSLTAVGLTSDLLDRDRPVPRARAGRSLPVLRVTSTYRARAPRSASACSVVRSIS